VSLVVNAHLNETHSEQPLHFKRSAPEIVSTFVMVRKSPFASARFARRFASAKRAALSATLVATAFAAASSSRRRVIISRRVA
jgi:hypothetical protein|tara:strand:- start:210 stop:458 length:249 start_codon:yes stop_codon:yes gene_type:complete